MRKNSIRYVLIMPCCRLLVAAAKAELYEARVFGPTFSSQVWSIVKFAAVCPKESMTFGAKRWTIFGKKPNIFEKWWRVRLGDVLSCLDVRLASSIATMRPATDTIRADSLIYVGMVITGVLGNTTLLEIKNPAIILPQAKRLMGLITWGSFSLIGERGWKRGVPIVAKKITRRL